MSNTDPTKKPKGNAGAREEYALTASDKVTPCYSYIQSSTVKVLAVIEERKKYTKKIKYRLSFEIWIFRYSQPDHDENRKISRAIDQ